MASSSVVFHPCPYLTLSFCHVNDHLPRFGGCLSPIQRSRPLPSAPPNCLPPRSCSRRDPARSNHRRAKTCPHDRDARCAPPPPGAIPYSSPSPDRLHTSLP